jgi:hypothetical protein
MGKGENTLQHLTRFLLGTAVALVCVLCYRSIVIKGGYYEKNVEAFALTSATQTSSGTSGEDHEVVSIDHTLLISREDQVNQSTVVLDATPQKVSRI